MTPRSVVVRVALVFTILNASNNGANVVACTPSPPPPLKVLELKSSRQLGDDKDPNKVVVVVVLFFTTSNAFDNGIGHYCDVATTPPSYKCSKLQSSEHPSTNESPEKVVGTLEDGNLQCLTRIPRPLPLNLSEVH